MPTRLMPGSEVETPEQYKKWVLNLVKDLRAPDKSTTEIVVKDGEQRRRQYENARKAAAETGSPEAIQNAKRLKAIVEILDNVVKARELTDKAQGLYENIDANRKKLKSLKELGEGNSEEAKKVQRQLERSRASLEGIETQRNAYGPNPKTGKAGATGTTSTTATGGTEAKAGTATKSTTGTQATPVKPTTPGTPTTPTKTPATPVVTDEQALDTGLDTAATDLSLPETLFKHVPSLKNLLDRYVAEKWTADKLRKEIRNDTWYRQNSAEVKARYVQLYNYQDLVASGQANGSTDYEKQIATLERKLADKARQVGSGLASDPVALRKAAENMYITNVGIDDPMTTDFIAAAIRPITSTIAGKVTEGYSGQALKDYQAIQGIAKANGFKISDVLPGAQNEQQVLQGLAKGTIDADRLAQDARKLAAQGQPQYVRDLLGQGYNLDQIFAPYRNTMANVLEINPDEIDLNDQTLRSAISDKGDMNIYDFKKQLKADNRWQYTENAKQEVSDVALKVLRDFGFQG